MRTEIEALLNLVPQAVSAWTSAFEFVRKLGIGNGTTYPNLAGATLDDFNTRLLSALALISGLGDADNNAQLLLLHRIQTLTTSVQAIKATGEGIISSLSSLDGASATDTNGQLNLQLSHPTQGASQYDLGSQLAPIAKHVATIIDLMALLSLATSTRGGDLFAEIARSIQTTLTSITDTRKQAEAELATGRTVVAELRDMSVNSDKLLQQTQEVLQSAIQQKTSVDGHASELEQKLARAREISKDADALQQRVTGFSAQFEAFETQMKARLEQFAQFERSTQEADKKNLAREKTIDELIAKADTMIRGATTAGLSNSLEDTKDAYEARLSSTGKWFLGSVIALLVCSLPIAAQIVPGPWQALFKPIEGVSTDPWLSTLGKLILLIPATWATAFFARNYAELFHLAREYAHKAALAKAVDGFKREAPEYKSEIVTGVFMEIRDNPGSRKSPDAATPQNPVVQGFLERVLDAIKSRKT